MKYLIAIILTIGLVTPVTACIDERGLTDAQMKRYCSESILATYQRDVDYLEELGVNVPPGQRPDRADLEALTVDEITRKWAALPNSLVVFEGWLVP